MKPKDDLGAGVNHNGRWPVRKRKAAYNCTCRLPLPDDLVSLRKQHKGDRYDWLDSRPPRCWERANSLSRIIAAHFGATCYLIWFTGETMHRMHKNAFRWRRPVRGLRKWEIWRVTERKTLRNEGGWGSAWEIYRLIHRADAIIFNHETSPPLSTVLWNLPFQRSSLKSV